MILIETVKSFLKQPESISDKESSEVKPTNVISDLSNNDLYPSTGVFFDNNIMGMYNDSAKKDDIIKQKNKIQKYRQTAMTADVNIAIDEIVNEIIFNYDDQIPIKLDVNEENDKLVEALQDKFKKIIKLTDLKRSLFNIVKGGYIDGKLAFHCAYDKKNTKAGIKSIKMIEPCMLYLDVKNNCYKYFHDEDTNVFGSNNISDKETYSIEEMIVEDFGLYEKNINLSYIEYAIKPANMLKTLEDLLIPMRFSRSISRRVFNVDIGDLPSKRGAEVMKEHQNKFKYKKFYNNETGEVSNQQHITSMVEDYWFSNRSGGKGTTVDVLDESGNLGELGDIKYFQKKLYNALKIPSNRSNLSEEENEFDYDTTRVTKEDMKFFMFVSRLRQVYSSLFKEILKREVISTGIMKESEWDDKEDLISISFVNQNSFIEKMLLDNFTSKLDIYATVSEFQGKLFSVDTVLKKIFNMNDDEIKDEFEKIKKEEENDLFAKFYANDEEDY